MIEHIGSNFQTMGFNNHNRVKGSGEVTQLERFDASPFSSAERSRSFSEGGMCLSSAFSFAPFDLYLIATGQYWLEHQHQMSFSASQSAVVPETRHDEKVVPTPEDLKVTRLVVAVHGIGNQFRYSTVQAVACRFATYCRRPITQPLGAFHPAKLITKPDSPELGAYLFEPPAGFEKDFSGFGFAEVFWSDIPELAAATKNTTEESKAWAQTIVERVRMLDQSSPGKSDLIDYKKASAVVEEMIGTIKVLENLLFITNKAGLFEFNLGQLLTDFLGDVQIVADFKDYGGDIFKRFTNTLNNLVPRMPNVEKIYIIAHSEGTVVSFKGLVTALADQKNPNNEWVNKVKGYMTIGSPLNKHIVMWPKLWQNLKPAPSRTGRDPILWRNYYDYGDPVGFNLEITREWMKENGWLSQDETKEEARFFQFGNDDDCGFTRYPFPGKAHNDYWNDADVFGHFIDEVVLQKGKAAKPRTIWWTVFVSRIVPYVLCLALLAGGTYVLYNTLVATFFKSHPVLVLWDVSGITCLLAGATLLSRMPRLDKIWPAGVIGAAAFAFGTIGYLTFASHSTQKLLSSPFVVPNGIIWWFFAIGLVSAVLSKWRPRLGMLPLIGLGGIAACLVLWTLHQTHPEIAWTDRSGHWSWQMPLFFTSGGSPPYFSISFISGIDSSALIGLPRYSALFAKRHQTNYGPNESQGPPSC